MSDTAATVRLRDAATFVRSKNAGPFMLTIDLFFDGPDRGRRLVDHGILSPLAVADLYGVPEGDVTVMHLPQASAVKITLPRPLPAGEVGERDVAGGQQFAPLLDLVVPDAG